MSDTNTTPDANPGGTPGTTPPPDSRRCDRRGHGRRRWFKVGLAALIGLGAFGLGRASGHWGHWRGASFGMNSPLDVDTASRKAEFGIGRILAKVDGTPEQKAKIGEIAKAAIKDLLPMRQQITGSRDKLAVALKADTLDRAAIERLRTEQVGLMETASKRAAQALTDAADVLSPAQRAKLVDQWQSHGRRG